MAYRIVRNNLLKLSIAWIVISISAALFVSNCHAQQLPNAAPTAPGSGPTPSGSPPVAFDQYVKFRDMMREEDREFRSFISTQTSEFKEFIYLVVSSAIIIVGAILGFFGWKTASGMRGQYELMLAKHLDKAEKQVEVSFKAAADEQISKRVAELNSRIDEAFATLQKTLEQRKVYIDRWFSNLSSPSEESVSFDQLMPGKTVLWVDDHPEYNKDMAGLLSTIGKASVEISESTDDALRRIERGKSYDIIISDMNRENDTEAGIKFVRSLRARKIKTPTIIFTGANSLKTLGEKAVTEGAYAVVASDPGLLRAMASAMRDQRSTGVEGIA
jgi:CheY-like chemotaxis protein